MNTCIEFHDSVLSEIEEVNDRCFLRFHSAYIHRSEGRPGIDAGDGYRQDLQIEIGGAQIDRPTITLPKTISDGWITVGDVHMSNCAPVPFFEENIVSMTIIPATEGAPIKIEGSSIEICVIGDAIYIESFSGSTK